jgi:hypothetical protein
MLNQFFKCLEVAHLAGSPIVFWRPTYHFLETLEQGDSFCAGNVEIFHSFRQGVEAGVKKGLEV